MTEFYSVTGEQIDLKNIEDEPLAEALDALYSHQSIVREQIGLVSRELAKRAKGKPRMILPAWTVTVDQRVHVTRRHAA